MCVCGFESESMATLKKNYRRELLVAGYVRDMKTIHKIKNVPSEINDIIYSYQRLLDVWNKKYSNKSV